MKKLPYTLSRVEIPGGFIAGDSIHAYLHDHQGNVRRVVNAHTGAVEQETHYYPFGMPFGESTATALRDINGSAMQPRRYGGKESVSLRAFTFLDFPARPYDAATARFLTPDPLQEKYTPFSPYLYCAANPMNLTDPTGMDWIKATYEGESFYIFHDKIKCQEDISKVLELEENYCEIKYVGASVNLAVKNGPTFTLNSDGSFYMDNDKQSSPVNQDGILHIGNINDLKNGTIRKNLFGSHYIGSKNPKNANGGDYYALPPINRVDCAAYQHDKVYDKLGASGASDALFNIDVLDADSKLVRDCNLIISNKGVSAYNYSAFCIVLFFLK